jgi:hypothetical protein
MESSNEQFERLRELLTCKKIERPAPDYFEELPSLVRERIESLPPPPPPSLFERAMSVFEYRPVLALAYGVVLYGGVYVGLRFSETLRQYPLPNPEAREWVEVLPLTFQSSQVWSGDESRARVMSSTIYPVETTGFIHEAGAVRVAGGSLFVTHGSNSEFQRANFQP